MITVHDPRFYHHAALGGALGAAEAYIRGYWDSTDLTAAMRVMARNTEALGGLEKGASQLLRPLRCLGNWLRRNSERFIRIWHYYLCYCEAAFHERQTGVSQILLTKPACRRRPVLVPTANGSDT